jgi:hypothetical protein
MQVRAGQVTEISSEVRKNPPVPDYLESPLHPQIASEASRTINENFSHLLVHDNVTDELPDVNVNMPSVVTMSGNAIWRENILEEEGEEGKTGLCPLPPSPKGNLMYGIA